MKTLTIIVTGIMLFLASIMQAQVSVSVNIGSPPMWGPAGHASVQYYYLPDVEAYYDVRSSMFIYFGGGAWIRRAYLPARYKGYDLYHGYKVVMPNYHGKTPYSHFKEHKMKYGKGYRGKPQRTIGERPGKGNSGARYYKDANHYSKGGGPDNHKSNGHGNDKHNKKDHGNGGGKDRKK